MGSDKGALITIVGASGRLGGTVDKHAKPQ